MVDQADSDADEATRLARGYSVQCLKVLANIADDADDPAMREYAQRELEYWLSVLREAIAAPGGPDDARAHAIETLRGFLDS